ncbi:MAG: DUF502 domain-containing protein [Verrucomicrobia bacterium]|nr:DUF502 domain-containing protein [Verrucomicrobiota bacterium]
MGKIFKRGLIAIAPLALTLALILWLFNTLESIFKPLMEAIVGPSHYFRGLGILVSLVGIFFIGIVINSWVLQRLSKAFEALLKRIPFVKTLYNSIGEMMSYFHSKDNRKEGKVVLVEISGMKLVGIITREDFLDTPKGIAEEGDIAVYLPMSYQIGGYTVILPKSCVKPISMNMEEGMRFAVTAGVLTKSKK